MPAPSTGPPRIRLTGAVDTPSPLTVVVADDSADLRLLLRATLDLDARFTVVGEASTAGETLERVGELDPDLVVVDLGMPGAEGVDIVRAVVERHPQVRVVVYSGYDAEEREAAARAAGAIGYLEKGRPLDEVIERLARDVAGTGEVDRPPPPTPGDAVPVAAARAIQAVVHGLRTPATVLDGLAGQLRRAVAEQSPSVGPLLDALASAAAKLRTDVDGLAEARDLQLGRVRAEPEVSDSASVIAAAELPEVWRGRAVTVDGRARAVWADLRLAGLALRLLVEDAALHGPAAEPVTVKVDADPDAVTLLVLGGDVPPADVFTIGGRPGGAQLGTSLFRARGLARAQGGDVVADRTDPAHPALVLRLPAP